MNDTDTFGAFMGTFLLSFRDEYSKLPSFAFPLMSGASSPNFGGDDVSRLPTTHPSWLTLQGQAY